ncbi:hypothetical protein [Porphyromonas gingivicanis]|uniref:hypothetical protein n=1 Tax=Porphyromonas gingivicanis TaxID=266762 RepID=UPI000AE71762|nr:hypothetical protein [Porphyromonas gingivicanis]
MKTKQLSVLFLSFLLVMSTSCTKKEAIEVKSFRDVIFQKEKMPEYYWNQKYLPGNVFITPTIQDYFLAENWQLLQQEKGKPISNTLKGKSLASLDTMIIQGEAKTLTNKNGRKYKVLNVTSCQSVPSQELQGTLQLLQQPQDKRFYLAIQTKTELYWILDDSKNLQEVKGNKELLYRPEKGHYNIRFSLEKELNQTITVTGYIGKSKLKDNSLCTTLLITSKKS